MNKRIEQPRGIYSTATYMGITTYSISYPIYRGFTLSADSFEALMALADTFWCPANNAGITSLNTLNKSIDSCNEDTAIIYIEDIPKVA